MSKSSNRLWLVVAAIATLVAAASFVSIWRNLSRRARPIIATVSGLSMSPSLRCAHFNLKCSDCGRALLVAAEQANGTLLDRPPRNVQCPQCGAGLLDAAAVRRSGDMFRIVPVDRYERFDVVAFGTGAKRVKRVVGLPGEKVEIDGGDVIINGEVLRKTFSEFLETSIVVASSDNNAQQSLSLDELFDTNGWEYAGRITDFNSFDPWTSRSLNHVGDIMVTMDVAFATVGQIDLQIDDGWQTWSAELRFGRASGVKVRLTNDAGVQLSGAIELEPNTNFTPIHFGCFDQKVQLHLSGQEVLSHSFHQQYAKRAASGRPLSIRAEIDRDEIESLVVRRDIHYLPNAINDPFATRTWVLESDQYFLLGDYSPVSVDSRSPAVGPVPQSGIRGRATVVDGLQRN